MTRYGDAQINRFGSGDKEGYSMFQLIETSNISGHFSEELNTAFIDIFSCREYDVDLVKEFTLDFFKGKSVWASYVFRGVPDLTRNDFYEDQGCKL
jgi:S-adenosylmethionine/arginine decarboxylase-like enzyme